MQRDKLGGIAVTIILILALEFGLRAYDMSHQPAHFTGFSYEIVPDEVTGYHMRPNTTLGQAHINSLSFRGDDISVEKPEGYIRVAMMGESTTIGIPSHPSFAEIIQSEIGNCPAQIINAGVEGYTTNQVHQHLIHDVLPLDPDTVVVYTGWNTMYSHSPTNADATTSRDSLISRITAGSYIVKYSLRAFYSLRSSDASKEERAAYESYTPEIFITELNALLDTAAEHHLTVVLVTLPSVLEAKNRDDILIYPAWVHSPELLKILWQKYNAVIREVAQERGLLLFDLDAVFQDTPGSADYFFDTMHFDTPGVELVARALLDFLRANGLIDC